MIDVRNTSFPVTDWRMVFAAGAEQSLGTVHARFCQLYWHPVHAFIRRSWPSLPAEDALEATQEFFTRRLAKRDLQHVDPEHGQFRNWLMCGVANLLRNLRKFEHAKKRDRRLQISMDAEAADAPERIEPRSSLDPLCLLERELAHAILERALARLGKEYRARGDGVFFERAAHLLVPGEADARYSELERRWGLPEQTLKVRVYTMRNRFSTLLRQELGTPPADPSTEKDQIDWLFRAVSLVDPLNPPICGTGCTA